MAVVAEERPTPIVEPAMTEENTTWELLLRTWQELDFPEGWRAEIRGEGVIVVPPPSNEHGRTASKVHRALDRVAPEDITAIQNIGVEVAALGKLYIPDLVFVAEAAIPAGSTPVSSTEVLLAIEITSRGNADVDRREKRVAYARGEVPLYLLVDPWDPSGPTVTLYSEPRGSDYDEAHRVPFGKPVTVPEPFEVELDTAGFPLPPALSGQSAPKPASESESESDSGS